ncbi:SET and MYND-domain-containing protein 3 [Mycena kentingensis (nom. inval.)]|nr:SET and MYND-domain-containing protein 3 [Mycena kentingensis (nom. inval.)]
MAPQPDSLDARFAKLDASERENANRLVPVAAGFFMLPISNRPDPYDFNADSLQTLQWIIGDLYPRMEQEFERSTLEQSKRAIVAVYARFSVDGSLAKRLLELGVLDQLVAALSLPGARADALDALCKISQHVDTDALLQMAEQTCQPLLSVLKESQEDVGVTTHIALIILARTFVPAIPRKQALPFLEVAQAFLDVLPSQASSPLFAMGIGFIVMISTEVKLPHTMVELLVAGLRSRDWLLRAQCLAGLWQFVAPDVQREPPLLDPLFQQAGMPDKEVPPHLLAEMNAYGYERCASVKGPKSNGHLYSLLAEEKDPYKLGKAIAALALGAERAIIEWVFTSGAVSQRLPRFAQAIRDKGVPSEANLAHILHFEYLRLQGRESEAPPYAREVLEQDPDFAYAYYALARPSADAVEALRSVKKGNKCTPGPLNLSDFLRIQFLQRGALWAAELGVEALTSPAGPMAAGTDWRVGIAMVQSALEDGEAFLDLAPPDHSAMRAVMSWLILLHVMTDEELSDDLRELKRYTDRLQLADDFTRWLKPFGDVPVPVPKTRFRLIADLITDNFAAAQHKWSKVFEEFDRFRGSQKAQRGDEVPFGHAPSAALVDAYRCSWCRNPSAALLRCGRCGKGRYCDAGCQKGHWKVHKKTCVASRKHRNVFSLENLGDAGIVRAPEIGELFAELFLYALAFSGVYPGVFVCKYIR